MRSLVKGSPCYPLYILNSIFPLGLPQEHGFVITTQMVLAFGRQYKNKCVQNEMVVETLGTRTGGFHIYITPNIVFTCFACCLFFHLHDMHNLLLPVTIWLELLFEQLLMGAFV